MLINYVNSQISFDQCFQLSLLNSMKAYSIVQAIAKVYSIWKYSSLPWNKKNRWWLWLWKRWTWICHRAGTTALHMRAGHATSPIHTADLYTLNLCFSPSVQKMYATAVTYFQLRRPWLLCPHHFGLKPCSRFIQFLPHIQHKPLDLLYLGLCYCFIFIKIK